MYAAASAIIGAFRVQGASLELRPFDKFTAGLGWELRARRRYYSLAQGQATEVGMGNISDLKFDPLSGIQRHCHFHQALNI